MGKIEYRLVGFCTLHQEKDVHRMIPFGSSGQKSCGIGQRESYLATLNTFFISQYQM